MDNLKEVLKPNEIDPALLQRIEKRYGSIDMENDFFSDDLSTYFKTSDIDPETGNIGHQIIKLANFGDALKELSQALQAMVDLSKTADGQKDSKIPELVQSIRDTFNKFRTHIRKEYPEQYNTIKNLLKETSMTGGGTAGASFTPGEGAQYATPMAFNKNKNAKGAKNIYYYKLGFKPVPKKIPGSGLEVKQLFKETNMYKYKLPEAANQPQSVAQYQNQRMLGFDRITDLLGQIQPLLDDAKAETEKYYKENPKSYAVVYGTDLIQDYLKDIISVLKNEDDENSTNTI